MRRVLVTAFGPFPGAPRNPTPEVLARLSPGRLAARGVTVVPVILATAWGALPKLVETIAVLRPDAVLLLGLAGRARAARVETRAWNRASPVRPDATGARPPRRGLDPAGPPRRVSRAPVRRIAAAVAAGGLPARISHDAGDYLCNAALIAALKAAPPRTRVVFLHLPPDRVARAPRPLHPGRAPRPAPSTATMSRAVERAVGALVAGT